MTLSVLEKEEILDTLVELERRPFDHVMWSYPWGEPGTELASRTGPEEWQRQVLLELQIELLAAPAHEHSAIISAYLIAIKSGKNVGKTCLVAWISWWAFTTRINTKGRATANTKTQITSVFWAEMRKWKRLGLFGELFDMTATQIRAADPKCAGEWFFDALPWSKDNPDAWAGIHNQGGRIILVFDEAAEIDDSIWERADGATREADTEVFWIATSNPTRNFGRFWECFQEKFKGLWHTYTVDSRSVSLTNHKALNDAISRWGLDSDYARVQILGEFPSASLTQLIPRELIQIARKRAVTPQDYEPLLLALDVARYGNNDSVASFRKGRDARSIPAIRRNGLSTVESGTWLAGLIESHNPDGTFIDEGGVGGGVVDFVRHLGHHCLPVLFGSKVSMPTGGTKVADKRAEMAINFLNWLREGGCIEDSDELEEELVSIQYFIKNDAIRLMSKEDMRAIGIQSPDWFDSIIMTFAFPVSKRTSMLGHNYNAMHSVDYNPFGPDALADADAKPSYQPKFPTIQEQLLANQRAN
jgi:hypothetical protein